MPRACGSGQTRVFLPAPAGGSVTVQRLRQCGGREGGQPREKLASSRSDQPIALFEPPAAPQPGRLEPLAQPPAIIGPEQRADPRRAGGIIHRRNAP
jgi:hypothetical protein